MLTEDTLGEELQYWFSKYIISPDANVDFQDKATFGKALAIFDSDYNRYYDSEKIEMHNVRIRAELQGILLYRIAREYFIAGNPLCDTYAALGRWLSGFEIYYSAEVGESFKINHGMGTVVGARSKIGKNATLHHGITLGDKAGGRPTLKNNVIVYPAATIIGNITIGNDCVVAANSVCMINVPDGATVAGNPAKIIKVR
ncbi:hypothetical protein BH09BAC5_BH09BAC5_11270 [soil metagenome]